MGVDEGSLQIIDIEVIMENCPIVLLYGTGSACGVFNSYYILHL